MIVIKISSFTMHVKTVQHSKYEYYVPLQNSMLGTELLIYYSPYVRLVEFNQLSNIGITSWIVFVLFSTVVRVEKNMFFS